MLKLSPKYVQVQSKQLPFAGPSGTSWLPAREAAAVPRCRAFLPPRGRSVQETPKKKGVLPKEGGGAGRTNLGHATRAVVATDGVDVSASALRATVVPSLDDHVDKRVLAAWMLAALTFATAPAQGLR